MIDRIDAVVSGHEHQSGVGYEEEVRASWGEDLSGLGRSETEAMEIARRVNATTVMTGSSAPPDDVEYRFGADLNFPVSMIEFTQEADGSWTGTMFMEPGAEVEVEGTVDFRGMFVDLVVFNEIAEFTQPRGEQLDIVRELVRAQQRLMDEAVGARLSAVEERQQGGLTTFRDITIRGADREQS